ncbi:phospho-acceptor domain-containing protein [Ruminiclostridium sufflavum DSM 19573]|uniref:histidine kinase n=1 Tax=Ruminiclostridium sufflavum DSM 19573 TaxID=1121337 RepID=A0A318XM60_9FIRM|nr:HAMP domain-containing sensor histidine kinase [Ruminiclostridium sufflavum]PYG88827.1 phospho-acceptor domain-containing protein [Ruminiclostridium sufflavum DSM 19573]
MERIKNATLKQSFFIITVSFLFVGILLGIASFIGCLVLREKLFASGNTIIEFGDTSSGSISVHAAEMQNDWPLMVLSLLQAALPILFAVVSLLAADIVFYKIKLKRPIDILKNSAERIRHQDLDFTVVKHSNDELGELSTAFETMRAELLKNNRSLWAQMEERKRLNAAFSHDLRNPVTVLKGSAKLLQKKIEQEKPTDTKIADITDLILQYSRRVETYVEAMTNAQKLEEMKYSPSLILWPAFSDNLKDSLSILCSGTDKKISFSFHGTAKQLWADRHIILNTAENLIYNAIRYAKDSVSVDIYVENTKLLLIVSDDGPGFSPLILQKGAAPFLRDDTAVGQEHFGMGLYVCRLMCEKHGGSLALENTSSGAKATAIFSLSKN